MAYTQKQIDRYNWLRTPGTTGGNDPRRAEAYKELIDRTGSQYLNEEDINNEQTLNRMRDEAGSINYGSVRGPDNKLNKDYAYDPKTLDLKQFDTFGKLKDYAMSEGPSKWAELMKGRQGLEEAALADRATRQAQSGSNQAMGSLAMRGGASSGARERLAQNMGRNLLGARQDVARQGTAARQDILTQDQAQKMEALKGVSQQEINTGQANLTAQNAAQQWNLEQALKDQQREQQFKEEQYKQKMNQWASEREAQATESHKGSGER